MRLIPFSGAQQNDKIVWYAHLTEATVKWIFANIFPTEIPTVLFASPLAYSHPWASSCIVPEHRQSDLCVEVYNTR